MTQLANLLASLGLEQYHDALTREGFDTWETVQDITEQDLEALNVKLGHRRKLQRFIASQRGINVDQPLSSALPDATGDRGLEGGAPPSGDGQGERGGAGAETKRKYKRHPKPDENAPERPPSAYVLFSNAIREDIKGQDLSFTDIAKLVGQRWQSLTAAEREPYETRAANLKDIFNQDLAQYKQTEQYREYSQYLADFKAKHGGASAEGKRPKLEEEHSAGSMGSPSTPTVASSKSPRVAESLPGLPGASHGRNMPGVSVPRVGSSGPESSPVAGQQGQSSLSGRRSYSGSAFADPLQHGRPQEVNRPSPRVGPSASPGDTPGYFDHPSKHGVREGSISQQAGSGSAAPFESGLFSRPAAKPQLFHQDTVISSASSVPSNLSYGSASTAPLQTPMTPRDDPWPLRPPIHDAYKSPSGTWDMPRPILPPFASPHSTSFSAVNNMKGPDRPPFSHHSEPAIRLPPPNVGLAPSPHDSPGLSLRGASRPAPSFTEQRRPSLSRSETLQGIQRPEKEGGSPLDLLAQAVDARDSRPERPPP